MATFDPDGGLFFGIECMPVAQAVGCIGHIFTVTGWGS
jgi:hypothetical protein